MNKEECIDCGDVATWFPWCDDSDCIACAGPYCDECVENV